jgi:hypothetical protein
MEARLVDLNRPFLARHGLDSILSDVTTRSLTTLYMADLRVAEIRSERIL